MFNKKQRVIFGAIILGFLVFGIVLSTQGYKVKYLLNKLYLLPRNETFTELYFTDYTKLPTKSVRGEEVNFSFSVHNVEGRGEIYPYSVYFEYPYGVRVNIKKGIISLSNNETKTVEVKYTFQTTNIYGKVFVELDNLDQKINFILPNYNY